MFSRNVVDEAGRSWACRQDDANPVKEGDNVSVLCTTPTVVVPVRISVGWTWNTLPDTGLARLITAKSPVPRKGIRG